MIQSVTPTVLTGQIAPLGPGGPPSGIAKRPIPGPWRITVTGVHGDAQGDLKHHGGPEKALHQYPRDHYPLWSTELGEHPLLSAPGAFGENLSTDGWTERDVCIGDVVRFGSAIIQMSQGRQPCFKLDLRFERPGMARAVQITGRTGWYWRVLQPGIAEPGAPMIMAERPRPDWPLSRLLHLLYVDTRNRLDLHEAAALPELAEGWRSLLQRRLHTGAVEDWSDRLIGAAPR